MFDRARRGHWATLSSWLAFALVVSGCSAPTIPVKGTLVFEKADVGMLSGSTIYCQSDDNPKIFAWGDIETDGTFQLWTKWRGRVVPGALAGQYHARIKLNGNTEKEFSNSRIDPLFLTRQSPLTFKVPSQDDIVLTVTRADTGVELADVPDRPAISQRCQCGGVEEDEDKPRSEAPRAEPGR